jgi:hypothetical protein
VGRRRDLHRTSIASATSFSTSSSRRFTFVLGTREFEVEQGGTVFVPRGTRHGFKSQPDSQALLIIAPAGLEGFFAELGDSLAAGRSNAEIGAALAGKYDSTPSDL